MRDYPESDWKVFRELRDVALDRYCQRVLEELQNAVTSASPTHHERYLRVCRLLKERDRDLAYAFDDLRRSRMFEQLSAIHSLGLVTLAELERFSAGVRESLRAVAPLR